MTRRWFNIQVFISHSRHTYRGDIAVCKMMHDLKGLSVILCIINWHVNSRADQQQDYICVCSVGSGRFSTTNQIVGSDPQRASVEPLSKPTYPHLLDSMHGLDCLTLFN